MYLKLSVLKRNSIEMPREGLGAVLISYSGRQKMSSISFFKGKWLLYICVYIHIYDLWTITYVKNQR